MKKAITSVPEYNKPGLCYGFDIYSARTIKDLNDIHEKVQQSGLSLEIKNKIELVLIKRIKKLRLPKRYKKDINKTLK